MKKKLFVSLFLFIFISCSMAFAFAADQKKEEITDLTPWLGHSVSILKLYQGEIAKRYFTEVQKYAPEGYTTEMVKDFIYKQFALKFKSLDVVDENTIIIDNKLKGDIRLCR